MKSLGLCIGASNIGLVVLEKGADNSVKVEQAGTVPHEGNPRQAVLNMVDAALLQSVGSVAVTGRKLKNKIKAPAIAEPEAVEHAYNHFKSFYENVDLIVSAGGETFIAYKLDQAGRVINVFTGNKCASGTGEFFLQQIKRMDLNVEEAVSIADLKNPYKVAGRCSVFCKSDCTHALNKGALKERVTAGLCEMMAVKVLELLKKTEHHRVMIIGGASANTAMLDFIKKEVPELIIPRQAKYFEAFGAALWALQSGTKPAGDPADLFIQGESSFSRLPAIKDFLPQVTFKEAIRRKAKKGDVCILGLDVGSTTTKAVVIRAADDAILADCYLRTNGDPVRASRNCYREINSRLGEAVQITGLGVTGSGRQIAGLHALTPAVINEIIAHAAAAVYFDPQVDTIFEIGGQDAKYTYITNGVASDYAMNEACSAGTGSFLEEAARESLYISTEEIGDIALAGDRPLNFSDQCAAFISSDIKSAIQEGAAAPDLAAGLVYSICMNYINRVKGNRAVGRKVFMQGGVCYNKALPAAMAALTGKDIVVPPEPGLMGAFGVALEVKNKLALGLLQPMAFDPAELAERQAVYREPFICAGGREKCDRKCAINRIEIKGKVYPFGGACNRYTNLLGNKKDPDTEGLDLVRVREKLVFEKYGADRGVRLAPPNNRTVAINNSLLTNTLFPLYYNFFTALGFDVLLGRDIDQEGVGKRGAEFCYPVEIAHGSLMGMIRRQPDLFFLPHVGAMPVLGGIETSVTCPFVQAEPYYLKAAFKELQEEKILSPVLDFSGGYESARESLITIGKELGCRPGIVEEACNLAVLAQNDFVAECQAIGREFLAEMERNPADIAIVLFGRPYNAFTQKANMGIPQKFASRGLRIIPYEFLPCADEEPAENMFWALGQTILKTARFVQRHNQLFPAYITNFSCGPDSFIVGFFRFIMGQKPSLTLELDSHSADAGLDTRIEAFLDVVKSYIELNRDGEQQASPLFRAAKTIIENGRALVVDSRGEKYGLDHPRVHVLVPSMGAIGSKMLAASLRHLGVRATAMPAPAADELKIGKGHATCKECLPLILTVGSLLGYLEKRRDKSELLVYFMPTSAGPCRFGQYNILIKNIIHKLRIEDVTQISLSCENSYAGLGTGFTIRAFQAVIISDVLEEVYSAILTIARDKDKSLEIYEYICNEIVQSVEKDSWKKLKGKLCWAARVLQSIEKLRPLEETPKAALVGEIYVRRDGFSRQYLVEKLAEKGIMVKAAPITEWIYYCDYLIKNNLSADTDKKGFIGMYIEKFFKNSFEKTIKGIFSGCGLYEAHQVDVERMIGNVAGIISPRLTVETILTVGSAITEVVEEVDGVISIGPFGCMPSRIAEAVIGAQINERKREIARDKELVAKVMERYPTLPFISIETDGNSFPQVIEARLEIFCLQVKRMHRQIQETKNEKNGHRPKGAAAIN